MAGDTQAAVLVSLLGAFGDPDPGARASAHAAFAVAARAAPRAACTAACDYAASVRQRASRSTGRVAADPGVLEALRSVTHALTDAPAGSVDPDTRRAVRGIATGAVLEVQPSLEVLGPQPHAGRLDLCPLKLESLESRSSCAHLTRGVCSPPATPSGADGHSRGGGRVAGRRHGRTGGGLRGRCRSRSLRRAVHRGCVCWHPRAGATPAGALLNGGVETELRQTVSVSHSLTSARPSRSWSRQWVWSQPRTGTPPARR